MAQVTRCSRNYPIPLVTAFERWQDRTSVAKQDAVAAAVFPVINMDGRGLDELMESLREWHGRWRSAY